ncbi:alkaline phosphatase family protein [Candidatus Binatus sp.]|uniref:alkaline phosphatase family protein n=1 Tax=Candidatus Binatus sp. TaxID=2811406 RepID=UPI002B45DF8E|nr:alkaline phosphatase family protein [Candidatus Binatus sp.]
MFSRRLSEILALLLVFIAAPTRAQDSTAAHRGRGRIVVLMVWDGLRPDFVTQRDTPNLFRLAREGVRFDKHHSIFPTLTMVNATALATGAPPGVNGLVGNNFYVAPSANRSKGQIVGAEGAMAILNLNKTDEFKGRLIGLDTIAQEVAREGGYVGVIGKQGPTSVIDNRVATIVDGKDIVGEPHKDYLFASEDFVGPASESQKITVPSDSKTTVADGPRDLYYARLAVEDALPAAKRAADAGKPALVVFWQHNPDLTQHVAGLGTIPAMEALSLCDNNLMRVRAAIDALGIADKTDLIVVSDHGFATIKFRIVLSEMLVSAGIKKSRDSTDMIVVPNGGADLVYLSPTDFPTPESRRAVLQKIVNFAEAQEWCGPIFSRDPATAPDESTRRGRRQRVPKPYLGWIDGTFSQRVVGLYNAARSPDLVISFREEPDADNKGLTGSGNPAFLIGQIGQVSTPNKSAALVHPVKGVVYADTGTSQTFTTGMGMHGAAGEREIHNFCAAAGPDFRRGFVDFNPTANTDVAPTITEILGTLPNIGPDGVAPAGRAMAEALTDGRRSAGGSRTQTMTADLMLQGVEAVTTLHVTWLGDEPYLDSSTVEHKPLGSSP